MVLELVMELVVLDGVAVEGEFMEIVIIFLMCCYEQVLRGRVLLLLNAVCELSDMMF